MYTYNELLDPTQCIVAIIDAPTTSTEQNNVQALTICASLVSSESEENNAEWSENKDRMKKIWPTIEEQSRNEHVVPTHTHQQ